MYHKSRAYLCFVQLLVIFGFQLRFAWLTDETTTRSEPVWDQSKMDPTQFQRSYCSDRCNDTEIVYTAEILRCPVINCFPCTCDKPLCQIYGTCCPDLHESSTMSSVLTHTADVTSTSPEHLVIDNNGTVRKSSRESTLSLTTFNLVCVEDKIQYGRGESFHLAVRVCSPSFADDDLRAKCEDEIPLSEQTGQTLLRVSDIATGVTFFNKYCALCNGIKEFTQWNLSVECTHYGKVYKALSHDQFLRLALEEHSGCSVSQKPPINLSVYHSCTTEWFGEEVGTCNVTGRWGEYDKDVEMACEEHPSSIADRIRVRQVPGKHYKNIFCSVCNMHRFPKPGLSSCSARSLIIPQSHGIRFRQPMPPFSLLINFDSQESRRQNLLGRRLNECSSSKEWPSPDNKCLSLQCSPGKLLVDGNCSTALKEIRGLAYKLRLLYLPRRSVEIGVYDKRLPSNESMDVVEHSPEFLKRFRDKLQNILNKMSSEAEVDISLFIDQSLTSQPFIENPNTKKRSIDDLSVERVKIKWFEVEGNVVAKSLYSRDDFEKLLVKELLSDIIITDDQNVSLALHSFLIPQTDIEILKCNETENPEPSCLKSGLSYHSFPYTLAKWDEQDILVMARELYCPHVSFNKSDYVIQVTDSGLAPTWSLSLNFDVTQLHFTETHELNMLSVDEEGILKVCQELLEIKVRSNAKNGTLRQWQYILTLICLSASLLCLVLTLMTYSLFQQLRSVAGKNNICLCTSLLLAQTFLIAASHVGRTGSACTALAICTHFLWLSMFCWCFACCFHMFRVFTAKTRSVHASANSETLYFVRRIALCSAVPAAVVITVIIINVVTSDGQRTGYGATGCFLDSSLLIATTMVTPLAVILVCNFVFFTVTIVKIHNVRKLQAHTDFKNSDRDNMYIYIKLSSMTGAFWIIQIISEALDNDPLRFIAIFLNGLQGVFIFLSYICNKRVLKLYARAMGLESYVPVSVTTDRSTLGRVASEVKRAEKENECTVSANMKTSPLSPDKEEATMESYS